MEVHDPYKAAFDRCGGGSTTLDDQQWTQFLDLLESTDFLSGELTKRFRQEHEAQRHSFELFQRDLCKWLDSRISCSQVDGIIGELAEKTQFLRQVADAQCQTEPIDVSFLHPIIIQAEAIREKLAGLEESASDILASKWVESDLFGSNNPPTEYERACPWKFQQANARYLRVEDRQRAGYHLRLHQCDENTDRVLKETFYPVLQQFREVQVGMAALASRKHNGSDDGSEDPELAIALMVRREKASEEVIIWLDNLVSAYRQLSLSPYVQQYLGSEDVCGTKQKALIMEGVTTRYYFEFVQARSLSDVLLEDGVLLETSPLFKLYARELLLAIIDLLEQSTHQLYTRVLPEHVMISHSGRRIFLGKLDFGDYVDPFQSNSLSTMIQKREKALFQDLSVVLFSMLYPVTLPQNLQDFRTQYLGRRDSKFVFRYRIKDKQPDVKAICVSCSDTFEIVLAGNSIFDVVWNCKISISSMLVCTNRRYSPMRFQFHTRSTGGCVITFLPLGGGATKSFSLAVRVCPENFRLQTSKSGTLISTCAAVGATPTLSTQMSPRILLHQHEYFQPLSKTESREAERELLERV